MRILVFNILKNFVQLIKIVKCPNYKKGKENTHNIDVIWLQKIMDKDNFVLMMFFNDNFLGISIMPRICVFL
jgi:hypothetical protein